MRLLPTKIGKGRDMPLSRKELLYYHEVVSNKARTLMEAKNHDYAGPEKSAGGFDVFANFRRAEALGLCKTEVGIMVRLSDKMSRASTFIQAGELLVKTESIEDLVMDGINYWILFGAYVAELGRVGKPEPEPAESRNINYIQALERLLQLGDQIKRTPKGPELDNLLKEYNRQEEECNTLKDLTSIWT